jgi:hypothetical protein
MASQRSLSLGNNEESDQAASHAIIVMRPCIIYLIDLKNAVETVINVTKIPVKRWIYGPN